jgi:hypothetical protein
MDKLNFNNHILKEFIKKYKKQLDEYFSLNKKINKSESTKNEAIQIQNLCGSFISELKSSLQTIENNLKYIFLFFKH